MALDYGRRRIGVAASDPLRVVAQPRGVVDAGSPAVEPGEALLERVRELEPTLIVVGVPLHMDGSEGEMANEARAEASRMADRTRSETRRLAKDARKKVDETGERLSEAVDQGRDRLRR